MWHFKSDCDDSKLGESDEEEPSIEDIQKAYQEMYDNWIKVCNVNKSLKDKIFELADENEELKGVVFNLKSIVKEKDEKVHEITTELESIKKNLRILNFGSTKLDQILNMGQSSKNGLGYTSVTSFVATTSKIVFVKAYTKT